MFTAVEAVLLRISGFAPTESTGISTINLCHQFIPVYMVGVR